MMKRKILAFWLCAVMACGGSALGSALPAHAQTETTGNRSTTQPAPVIANCTVYMTGYYYGGYTGHDGVATIPLSKVPADLGISQEDIVDRGAAVSTSNQSVLQLTATNITEEGISLWPSKAGTATVVFAVDGVRFAIKMTVYEPAMSSSALMYLKQKKTLTVKGMPAGVKPKFSSSNKKVATVNASGKVTARAKGSSVIYASVGTVKLGCVVAVTTKKKVRAINRAVKMAKNSHYSQRKRMRKGYYDCSSLVWRSYKPEGYKFGNKRYAPTAALEAKYLARKKRILGKFSYKNVLKRRYQAGDLIFLTGHKNGRYKGIYHVEMFRGYSYIGSTETGAPVVASLWANRPDGQYDYGVKGIMGRP